VSDNGDLEGVAAGSNFVLPLRLLGVLCQVREQRSGVWIKHRVNLGQEFVIGGFTPRPHGLDATSLASIVANLVYVARTRNGFVPASRRRVFEKLRPLVTPEYPFVNSPEIERRDGVRL
jgi:hypothetical protein